MWKKLLLLALAFGFFAAANARLCCTLSLEGRRLDALYSPWEAARGEYAARLAAEEIVSGHAGVPAARRSWRLSLSPALGQARTLSDAMLRATEGIAVTKGVYVDGQRLGAVSDGNALRTRLERFIRSQLPSWAVTGQINGQLELRPQYSRKGAVTDPGDMVLLISGMAPVLYSDNGGHVSWA